MLVDFPIYDCRLDKSENNNFVIEVDMTLTAPGCGMADVLVADIQERIEMLPRDTVKFLSSEFHCSTG